MAPNRRNNRGYRRGSGYNATRRGEKNGVDQFGNIKHFQLADILTKKGVSNESLMNVLLSLIIKS